MRFPMNTYKAEGTSWGKLSAIASLIWFLFFKQRFPFSHMLPLFQDNSILVEIALSHFFRVTASTQQLLFRGSYFFRTAAVFSFFRTVTFSQKLFFQNSFFFGAKILQSSQFTTITFRNSSFFRRTYLGQRYQKKGFFFKAVTSAQH